MDEVARLGALMLVHAEDAGVWSTTAGGRAVVRRLPGVPAARGRAAAIAR